MLALGVRKGVRTWSLSLFKAARRGAHARSSGGSTDCTDGVRFSHGARKMKACMRAQRVRETRSGVGTSAGLSEGRRRAGAAVRAVATRPKKKRRGSRAGQREKEKARIWACSGQIQTE